MESEANDLDDLLKKRNREASHDESFGIPPNSRHSINTPTKEVRMLNSNA